MRKNERFPVKQNQNVILNCFRVRTQFLPTLLPLIDANTEANCMKALLFSSVKILKTHGRF